MAMAALPAPCPGQLLPRTPSGSPHGTWQPSGRSAEQRSSAGWGRTWGEKLGVRVRLSNLSGIQAVSAAGGQAPSLPKCQDPGRAPAQLWPEPTSSPLDKGRSQVCHSPRPIPKTQQGQGHPVVNEGGEFEYKQRYMTSKCSLRDNELGGQSHAQPDPAPSSWPPLEGTSQGHPATLSPSSLNPSLGHPCGLGSQRLIKMPSPGQLCSSLALA